MISNKRVNVEVSTPEHTWAEAEPGLSRAWARRRCLRGTNGWEMETFPRYNKDYPRNSFYLKAIQTWYMCTPHYNFSIWLFPRCARIGSISLIYSVKQRWSCHIWLEHKSSDIRFVGVAFQIDYSKCFHWVTGPTYNRNSPLVLTARCGSGEYLPNEEEYGVVAELRSSGFRVFSNLPKLE